MPERNDESTLKWTLFPSIEIDDAVTNDEPTIDETQARRQSDISDDGKKVESHIW
jgi:hypothetical protein